MLIALGGKTLGLRKVLSLANVKELRITKRKLTCSGKVPKRDRGTNEIAPIKISFLTLLSTGYQNLYSRYVCSVPIKDIPVVCEPFEVRGTQNKSVGAQLCTGGESAMCIERTNSLCTEAEKSFKKQPGLLGSFPSTTFKNEWKLLFGPESNGAEVLWPTGKTCEESGRTLLLESGGHHLVPAWSLLRIKMRRKPG